MTIDDPMQKRMTALSDVEASPLDDSARERIRKSVVAAGPRVVRRARVVRAVVRNGAVLVVSALVASALTWKFGNVKRTEEKEVIAAHRACESFDSIAGRRFEPAAGGGARLDLGTRALIVADPGTEAELVEGTGCMTSIALSRGRVTVHARALGGGELQVTTEDTRVVVHGTIFSVSRAGEETMVEVTEGLVEVVRHGKKPAMLRAGERISSLPETAELEVEDEPAHEDGARAAPRTRRRRSIATRPEAPPRVEERSAPAPSSGDSTTDELDREMTGGEGERGSREPRGDPQPRWPRNAYKDPAEKQAPPAAKEKPRVEERAPEPEPTVEELVRRGDMLRRAGDVAGARAAYEKAGAGEGRTAEAAWLALARLELGAGVPLAARRALEQRAKRFGEGSLAVEAAWILVRALADSGDRDGARREAERIVSEFPKSPQAVAARKWIAEHAR